MSGLDLETFLRLLQADIGVWLTLGLVLLVLVVMTWTSWGSRRALRKCLMLSVVAHAGAIYYGGRNPELFLPNGRATKRVEPEPERIRAIEVRSSLARESGDDDPGLAKDQTTERELSPWDGNPRGDVAPLLEALEPEVRPSRPELGGVDPLRDTTALAALRPEATEPDVEAPGPHPDEARVTDTGREMGAELAPLEPGDIPIPEVVRNRASASGDQARTAEPATRPARPATIPRTRPGVNSSDPGLPSPRPLTTEIETREPIRNMEPMVAEGDVPDPADPEEQAPVSGRPSSSANAAVREVPLARPDVGSLRPARPSFAAVGVAPGVTNRPALSMNMVDLNRPAQADISDLLPGPRIGTRPLGDVPTVYRPRLDPNRSSRARQAGATDASEQAVERALAWLARHQDEDGRWNAGTARYGDGSPAPGDASFTSHCPPGDLCHGECFYWEADTAVTGLALLTFLGAGYTHQDGGKYSTIVGNGLEFLIREQKSDGDLRGRSKAVGMYCHAMASLALSEAYALSGDARLRAPVERAVGFIIQATYPDLMGWRYSPSSEISAKPSEDGKATVYSPHPPMGDTSVLGWVVLVLKSATEIGVDVPRSASRSAINWLKLVSDGNRGGLARYQPTRAADPTMTAEAWVCRQFLGVEDRGEAAREAGEYLLLHPPSSDRFNIYYWYYGTLAMYQRGGRSWERWNPMVRDELVRIQHQAGHKEGSWDPDPTRYGTHGGRLYTTALAALTLEVYYRYLRLYESPLDSIPPSTSDPIAIPPSGRDDGVRRSSSGR